MFELTNQRHSTLNSKEQEVFRTIFYPLYIYSHSISYIKSIYSYRLQEVQVASRFDLSDPSGTVRLESDPYYFPKFNDHSHHVDVVDSTVDKAGGIPEFYFDILFI